MTLMKAQTGILFMNAKKLFKKFLEIALIAILDMAIIYGFMLLNYIGFLLNI